MHEAWFQHKLGLTMDCNGSKLEVEDEEDEEDEEEEEDDDDDAGIQFVSVQFIYLILPIAR